MNLEYLLGPDRLIFGLAFSALFPNNPPNPPTALFPSIRDVTEHSKNDEKQKVEQKGNENGQKQNEELAQEDQ